MADTGRNIPQIDPETIAEERLRQGFLDAIGQGAGSVRVDRKDAKTGKRLTCGAYDIFDGNYDAFIDELRADYPQGGDFICRVTGPTGKLVTNGIISLEPNPRSRQATSTQVVAPVAAPGESNFEKMLIMMMNQQQASADRMTEMFMGIVTAMIKSQGSSKGESAGELLTTIIDAQAKLRPAADDTDRFEKTLDTMLKVRQALGDPPQAEGIGGILQGALPIFAAMAQQHQANMAQQQPQHQVRQVTPQLQQPAPAPAVQDAQPQPDALFLKYQPLMHGIRQLIATADPSEPQSEISATIADYIELQVRAGQVDVNDLNMLLTALQTMPDQVAPTLALYGVTDAAHVQIILGAIPLLAGGVEGDLPAAG